MEKLRDQIPQIWTLFSQAQIRHVPIIGARPSSRLGNQHAPLRRWLPDWPHRHQELPRRARRLLRPPHPALRDVSPVSTIGICSDTSSPRALMTLPWSCATTGYVRETFWACTTAPDQRPGGRRRFSPIPTRSRSGTRRRVSRRGGCSLSTRLTREGLWMDWDARSVCLNCTM
ncbi:unnamed protein product [Linum tenue]|uniref:Uncharacterized protein n=1 Tax=Linum tenue TaxID=586396 RepID=A0AAV0RXY2_9ROSI|nr:unnamed protein product [Linum tenue]